MQYFSDIKEDDAIMPGAVELVDLSRVGYFNVDFREAAEMPSGYQPAHEVKKIRGTILFGANEANKGLAELIRAHFNRTFPHHFFMVTESTKSAWAEARRLLGDGKRGTG